MKKQIATIVLGAVVLLGAATTLFAQNGHWTGSYPVMSGTDAGCDVFHVYCSGSTSR